MIDMKWVGDKISNYGSRIRGNTKYPPIAIVNHIMEGYMNGTLEHFENPSVDASSNFGVSRKGIIHQYVRIENEAWTQGLTSAAIPLAPAPLVRRMGVNPNLYCISIEHEGYGSEGGDGKLTEEQFLATCWLHKYIQHEVERIWGNHIVLSPEFVLGHSHIDPKRKPFCPGPAFPWARLYAELAKAESMSFAAWEEYIDYHSGGNGDYAKAYSVSERARDLQNKLTDPRWGGESAGKLLKLTPIVAVLGYTGEVTAAGIADRLLELYDTLVKGGKFAAEALRKLLIAYTQMKEKSLL